MHSRAVRTSSRWRDGRTQGGVGGQEQRTDPQLGRPAPFQSCVWWLQKTSRSMLISALVNAVRSGRSQWIAPPQRDQSQSSAKERIMILGRSHPERRVLEWNWIQGVKHLICKILGNTQCRWPSYFPQSRSSTPAAGNRCCCAMRMG